MKQNGNSHRRQKQSENVAASFLRHWKTDEVQRNTNTEYKFNRWNGEVIITFSQRGSGKRMLLNNYDGDTASNEEQKGRTKEPGVETENTRAFYLQQRWGQSRVCLSGQLELTTQNTVNGPHPHQEKEDERAERLLDTSLAYRGRLGLSATHKTQGLSLTELQRHVRMGYLHLSSS